MATLELSEDQLARVTKAISAAMAPMFEALLDRIKQMEQRPPVDKSRMTLNNAAPLYDMKLSTLQLKCIRGEIPGAVKLGKRWYVTQEGMDQAFNGDGAPKAAAKRTRRQHK